MDSPQLSKIRPGDLLRAIPGHGADVPDGKLIVAMDSTGLYVTGFSNRIYLSKDNEGCVAGFVRPPLENA